MKWITIQCCTFIATLSAKNETFNAACLQTHRLNKVDILNPPADAQTFRRVLDTKLHLGKTTIFVFLWLASAKTCETLDFDIRLFE